MRSQRVHYLFTGLLILASQTLFCQLKTYTIPGFVSAFSHSAAVRDDNFCISYSNEDGMLSLLTLNEGCFTTGIVNESKPILCTSAAFDSKGNIHICYAQPDINDWPKSSLLYTNNVSGVWSEPAMIMIGENGIICLDLFVDPGDHLHLGFMAGRMASKGKMYYYNTLPGYWTGQVVGSDLEAYDYCSMVLDKNGFVHFAFYGFTPWLGPGYITNAPSGSWQAPEEIHPDWRGGQMEGSTIRITTDSEANPHISYSGDTYTDPPSSYLENQLYAWKTGTGWEHRKIDNGSFQGRPNCIFINTDNRPWITYSNAVTDKMMLARDSLGTWVKKVLGNPAAHGKISSLKNSSGKQFFLWDDWSGEMKMITDYNGFAAGSVDKLSLNYGGILLGEDSTMTVMITNPGDSLLRICGLNITGDNKGEFYADLDKTIVLPGDTCRVNVTFKPLRAGSKNAILVISSNSLEVAAAGIKLEGICKIVYNEWAVDVRGGRHGSVLNSCIATQDGNYIAGTSATWGMLDEDGPDDSSEIIKVDGSGSKIWQKGSEYFNIMSICESVNINNGESEGYLLSGAYSTDNDRSDWESSLIKLDRDGHIMWSKILLNSGAVFKSVNRTIDGGWIIGGRRYTGEGQRKLFNFQAIKINSTDIIEWQKEYGFDNDYWSLFRPGWKIIQNEADSGFVILAQRATYPDPERLLNLDVILIKADKNGNPEWAKSIGYHNHLNHLIPASVIELKKANNQIEGYLIASQLMHNMYSDIALLTCLDTDGSVRWNKVIGPAIIFPAGLVQTSDSTFVLLSDHSDNTEMSYFQLISIKTSGEPVWKSAFRNVSNGSVKTGISVCPDKGFFFAVKSQYERAYDLLRLYKTDSLGRIPGCQLEVNPGIVISDLNDPEFTVRDISVEVRETSCTFSDFTIDFEDKASQLLEACTYTEPTDYDKDGHSDEEESGPDGDNSGWDGNNDGTPDNIQANVVSFFSHLGDYITIASPPGTFLSGVSTQPQESIPVPDPSYTCLYDFFSFTVNGVTPGGTTEVDFYLPDKGPLDTYYKLGSAVVYNSGSFYTVNNYWYEFMYNDTIGAVIDDSHIILHFVDGKLGDDDLEANGKVTDMGGPAIFIAPDISVSIDTLEFSTINPGANETKNIVIKNNGEKILLIDSVMVCGANSLLFEVPLTENLEILPGQQYSLPVTFAPRSPGKKNASLVIYSNDTHKGPQKIVLLGICSEVTGTEKNDLYKPDPVMVWPNPANDLLNVIINIPCSGKSQFEILDTSGKKYISGQFERIYQIDIRALTPGIYVIKVNFDRKTLSKSFVII